MNVGRSQTLFSGPGTAYLFQDDINGIQHVYEPGLGYVFDNGILYINGTQGDNELHLDMTGDGWIAAASMGLGNTGRSASGVSGIVINGRGGNDTIHIIRGKQYIPITVNGGDGNDALNLASGTSQLTDVWGHVTFNGGAGSDTMYLWDDGRNTAAYDVTYTAMGQSIGAVGNCAFGGADYGSDVENLVLSGAASSDNFYLQDVAASVDLQVWGQGGDDNFEFGAPDGSGSADGINGDVAVYGGTGFNQVHYNDQLNSRADIYTLSNASSTRGALSRSNNGVVWYQEAARVNLWTGTAGNSVTIQGTPSGSTVLLDSHGGNDTVTVGSVSAGGAQLVLGSLIIGNSAGTTTLTVTDAGDTAARSVTVEKYYKGATYSGSDRISGLAPAWIQYATNETSRVTLCTGGGADAVTVLSSAEDLTVTSSGGADTVTLSSAANIDARLTVYDGAPTPLLRFQTRDSATDVVTIDVSGGYHNISGMVKAGLRYKYVAAMELQTGSGADTVTVARSSVPLTVTSMGGADRVTLGNGTDGMQSITGVVTVDNAAPATVLTLNDAPDLVARTVIIGAEDPWYGCVDGLAPARVRYRFAGLAAAGPSLLLGGGSDFLTLRRTTVRPLSITAGAGNDTLYACFERGTVADIETPVTFDGGNDADTVSLWDDRDPLDDAWSISGGSVVSSDFGGLTYLNCEGLFVCTGEGSNTFDVGPTAATALTLEGGSGSDTFNVQGSPAGGAVTVAGGSGLDVVNINTDNSGSAAVVFTAADRLQSLALGAGGSARIAAAGSLQLLQTNALSLNAAARLDLTTNALIVRAGAVAGSWIGSGYNGISGLIASGRNGGTWTGNGIVTTSAGGGNLTTLGVAAASSRFGIAGGQTALWCGEVVDAACVLLKYTYGGDANLDGKINVDDYGKIDSSARLGISGWYNGDFNYDGKINVDDYGIIDFTIGIQGPPLGAARADGGMGGGGRGGRRRGCRGDPAGSGRAAWDPAGGLDRPAGIIATAYLVAGRSSGAGGVGTSPV